MSLMSILGKTDEKGVAAIVMVVVIGMALLLVTTAIASTNLSVFQTIEGFKSARSNYYLAESGAEDSLILLIDDINFNGYPLGLTTPFGLYYSTVDSIGENHVITSWALDNQNYRKVKTSINAIYDYEPVVTKATYMADFFVIMGEGARVRGDVWTNDDFDIGWLGTVEGNLTSIGKGSMAVNWVWDSVNGGDPSRIGGKVVDNPDTAEIEGNIFAFDDVKISGPNTYVSGNVVSNGLVLEIFGGDVQGTITNNAGLTYDNIPVPVFDFEIYQDQAIAEGRYYNNSNTFGNYVDSLDNGETRTLPDGVYYIKNGVVKIGPGSPVYLNGTLVVEDNLKINCAWYHNSLNNLPALVSGKQISIINKFDLGDLDYDYAGPVRINGVVYAETRIDLFRDNADEDIIIDGAVWAGDDIFILDHSFVNYDDTVKNTGGFGFASGISGIEKVYWIEDMSY